MSKATQSIMQLARMRIIALPLTSGASSSGQHTYYHFQTPPPSASKSGKPSLLKRATTKASDVWAGFGKAPQGTWKQRAFQYGERIVDRIDFEELALKSMDPSLGPRFSKFGKSGVELDEKERPSIPLVYPTFFGSKISPTCHLQTLLERRTPSHRKGFYFWMLISPLTAPFMLIPVIPNLPFFFCAWRSWHHYKAFKASSYLESLLESDIIRPEPNSGLDQIYKKYAYPYAPSNLSTVPTTTNPATESTAKSQPTTAKSEKRSETDQADSGERLMLSREAVPKIVSLFELPSSAAADLYRALEQTSARLEKAQVA